jgi:hypothetical protein
MSRAAVQDNSTDFSLFPFLAVLLCTMGALIVVLVGVSRMSRDQAREQVARKRSEATSQPAPAASRHTQLENVRQYLARLEQIRAEAGRRLSNDQVQLRDLEDHMRRLQDEAASVGAAAAELDALQQQHHDDREQAQREVARLDRLIAETRQSIDELEKESTSRPRSYAIVPYTGPHGTHRPPIYLECRRDAVILQPEGIRLTKDDFRPPIGPGNPLAAALRAARAHFARLYPDAEIGSEHDPYPLILIRPEGVAAYYIVREAIESWDSDFGYEMIGGDWDLAFPPPDPELATAESQAIELARLRMRMLAEAAPRAYSTVDADGRDAFPPAGGGLGGDEFDGDGGGYGCGRPGGTGDGSIDGEPGGGYGQGEPEQLTQTGDGSGGGMGDGAGVPLGESPSAWSGQVMAAGDGSGGTGPGLGESVDGGGRGANGAAAARGTGGGGEGADTSAADPGGLAVDGSPGDATTGSDATAGAGQLGGSGVASAKPTGAAGTSAGQSAGAGVASGAASATGSAGAAAGGTGGNTACSSGADSMQSAGTQGANALSVSVPDADSQGAEARLSRSSKSSKSSGLDPPHRGPDSIPIRRSIHLVVRADRVAILPERSSESDLLTRGNEVQLPGSTEAALDQVVAALREHVAQWGIAGRGLFWRPVVVLTVSPDGQQRADELVTLLKRRGIELRYQTTAQRNGETETNATR